MITVNQRKQYKLMLYHTAEISNLSCSPEMWKKLSTMYHFHRPQNKSQSETAVLREPHSIKKLDMALVAWHVEELRPRGCTSPCKHRIPATTWCSEKPLVYAISQESRAAGGTRHPSLP